MWLQYYATWPKIMDGKNISSSIDTSWFKPTFNKFLLVNIYLLILSRVIKYRFKKQFDCFS